MRQLALVIAAIGSCGQASATTAEDMALGWFDGAFAVDAPFDRIVPVMVALARGGDVDGTPGLGWGDIDLDLQMAQSRRRGAEDVAAFLAHDLNGDLTITRVEAERAALAGAPVTVRGAAGKALAEPAQRAAVAVAAADQVMRADSNGDGALDPDEVTRAVAALRGPPAPVTQRLRDEHGFAPVILRSDSNGDGNADPAELAAFILARLAAWDSDQSGTISQPERKILP